jgi:hypothetical protein
MPANPYFMKNEMVRNQFRKDSTTTMINVLMPTCLKAAIVLNYHIWLVLPSVPCRRMQCFFSWLGILPCTANCIKPLAISMFTSSFGRDSEGARERQPVNYVNRKCCAKADVYNYSRSGLTALSQVRRAVSWVWAKGAPLILWASSRRGRCTAPTPVNNSRSVSEL